MPRASFLTFFLFEPRGSVRFAWGAAFLRAARFSFFRSCVSSILVVSATCNLFRCNLFRVSRKSGGCDLYGNREIARAKAGCAGASRILVPQSGPESELVCGSGTPLHFRGTMKLDLK